MRKWHISYESVNSACKITWSWQPGVPYDRPLPTTLCYNMGRITLPALLTAATLAARNQSQSIPGVTRLADLCSLLIQAGTLSLQRLILEARHVLLLSSNRTKMMCPCARPKNWRTWKCLFLIDSTTDLHLCEREH